MLVAPTDIIGEYSLFAIYNWGSLESWERTIRLPFHRWIRRDFIKSTWINPPYWIRHWASMPSTLTLVVLSIAWIENKVAVNCSYVGEPKIVLLTDILAVDAKTPLDAYSTCCNLFRYKRSNSAQTICGCSSKRRSWLDYCYRYRYAGGFRRICPDRKLRTKAQSGDRICSKNCNRLRCKKTQSHWHWSSSIWRFGVNCRNSGAKEAFTEVILEDPIRSGS